MEKYKFENNKAVVDQPCIITISKSSVSIEHASNTDSTDIPDAGLTIQVGNVESYNPTSLSPEPEPEITPNPSSGGSSSGSGNSGESGGNSGSQEGGSEQGGESGEDTSNGIGFVLINECGNEVRLSGRITLNISQTPTNWNTSTQVSANINGPTNGTSWSKNTVSIPVGGRFPWTANVDNNYTNGNYYFVSIDQSENSLYSIYLYTRTYRRSQQKTEGSTGIYRVAPLQNTKLERGKTYTLRITSMYEDATLDPNDTTKGYVILPIGEESL